jgi:hypothetical protein
MVGCLWVHSARLEDLRCQNIDEIAVFLVNFDIDRPLHLREGKRIDSENQGMALRPSGMVLA